ncbi:hypothetical protein D3C72_2318440 [compost metagenome]
MSVIKANDLLDNSNKVAHLENAIFSRVCYFKTKALVQLETANAAVVETLEVEEHTFDHAAGIINGRKITWT